MEQVWICLWALIPMVIIMFIVNNIIPNTNYAKRALFLGIVFVGFLVFFGGGMIYDYYQFGIKAFKHYQYYLAVGSITLLSLGLITYNIIKATRYHHHLGKSVKRYDKNINQFLYIVYRYGGMYYIKKDNKNGKTVYGAECTPFSKTSYFYDEAFNKHINRNHININDYSYIGTATSMQKKKLVFYCFIVDLKNDENLEDFERISPYEIATLEMLDLHKTLIMHILIGEQFNIEL